MARLRRRNRNRKIQLNNLEEELLIPDYQENKTMSKKELELEMEHLRLEIRLNNQIRRLIDKEMKKFELES
jgi:hypothetical protein